MKLTGLFLILMLLFLMGGCGSKRKVVTETTESQKAEQVVSKTDSSTQTTLKSYEEAIEANTGSGVSLHFDSLSTVEFLPSGIIRATGYALRVAKRDTSTVSTRIISGEQTSKDTLSRAYESKSQESAGTEREAAQTIKKGFPWWLLLALAGIGCLVAIAGRLIMKYLKPL